MSSSVRPSVCLSSDVRAPVLSAAEMYMPQNLVFSYILLMAILAGGHTHRER